MNSTRDRLGRTELRIVRANQTFLRMLAAAYPDEAQRLRDHWHAEAFPEIHPNPYRLDRDEAALRLIRRAGDQADINATLERHARTQAEISRRMVERMIEWRLYRARHRGGFTIAERDAYWKQMAASEHERLRDALLTMDLLESQLEEAAAIGRAMRDRWKATAERADRSQPSNGTPRPIAGWIGL